MASGIPYVSGFIRNHYVGRSFIMPSARSRLTAVRLKLSVIAETVSGKRVVVVDDSIVRGTTSANRIRRLREAGAKEVHVRVSCPPIRHPCYYGIDFPTRAELAAHGRTVEQIRELIGADSLGYLSVEGMLGAVRGGKEDYCIACYTGEYPVAPEDEMDKLGFERPRSRSGEKAAIGGCG
jgi:amidophosphoribosyltransferase